MLLFNLGMGWGGTLLLLTDLAGDVAAAAPRVSIEADQQTVPMGRTVRVEATLTGGDGQPLADWVLLPYVNERRWGAHEHTNTQGYATFLLPLPNPGPARILVVARPVETDHWTGLKDPHDLLAGRPLFRDALPAGAAFSNTLDLTVERRAFTPRPKNPNHLVGMQWEPWFTPKVAHWQSAHAVPVIGFYDSYNRDVIRQHMLWFMDLGVDFIMADWSNHIWGKKHWSERDAGVNTILHATQLTLEVLAELRDEGLPAPKMVLMPGISNGPPATMAALNEMFDWIDQNYLRNSRFDGLWQELDGKPLIVVLDTGAVAVKEGTTAEAYSVPFIRQTMGLSAEELDAWRAREGGTVDDTRFTVRWMSTQLQITHHERLGYWTWMDGSVAPVVTRRNGQPEAVTVTPSFFAAYGWKGLGARGRRGGATYLDSFKTALAWHPRVLLLHQWNEYAGQAEGHGYGPQHDIYVDSYNVELSDDLEPVSPTAPGFRGDHGGWGYTYYNLTRALLDLYHGANPGDTLLAIAHPLAGEMIETPALSVEWAVAGAAPASYTLTLDGRPVAENINGLTYELPLAGLPPGPHTLAVSANGARTHYTLSRTGEDTPLANPIAVRQEVTFTVR